MIRASGRRVVISGAGVVSPCGSSLAELGAAVIEGRSAAAPIATFDATLFPTSIAAAVSVEERIEVRRDREAAAFADVEDLKTAFGIVAARRALADAGWEGSREAAERVAVVLGTGLSSLSRAELEEDFLPFLERDAFGFDLAGYGRTFRDRARAQSPARHLTDQANRVIARLADAGGRSLSHFGACAASTQAIGDAFRMVSDGAADAAIAGGMDSMVHPFGMISFILLGALSTKSTPPARACKPVHKDRDGFLLWEGA